MTLWIKIKNISIKLDEFTNSQSIRLYSNYIHLIFSQKPPTGSFFVIWGPLGNGYQHSTLVDGFTVTLNPYVYMGSHNMQFLTQWNLATHYLHTNSIYITFFGSTLTVQHHYQVYNSFLTINRSFTFVNLGFHCNVNEICSLYEHYAL